MAATAQALVGALLLIVRSPAPPANAAGQPAPWSRLMAKPTNTQAAPPA